MKQATIEAIRWVDGQLLLLDQRALPGREEYLTFTDAVQVARAIADLVVRGAPAIGITAAYGVVLSARTHSGSRQAMDLDIQTLANARPTAINLAWALERMTGTLDNGVDLEALEQEAIAIHREDVAANRSMGERGASLLDPGSTVLTHCNTGALATGGYGTALGVIRAAHDSGRIKNVYAGETRPWLQGARLTAWELVREEIPVTLVLEAAVASLFARETIDWLIVGADRIVANGDVANKIGTYAAALHARHHGARVMVVAPTSTIDLNTPCGDQVPIEERASDEVLTFDGHQTAATGAKAWNPVFDITPNELVDAIVTEAGIARAPYSDSLSRLMASG